MKYVQTGFSILFILVLMATFTLIAGMYMQTTSFLRQLSFERQKQEYHYWAMYGLVQYALAEISAKKEVANELTVLAHWPTAESDYQGKIEGVEGQQGQTIVVQLCKDGLVVREEKFFLNGFSL